MSGMNWQRARSHGRATTSIKDEAEWLAKDPAARWLGTSNHKNPTNWKALRKRKRARRRQQKEVMTSVVIAQVDGVRMLMKAGSKPPPDAVVSYFGSPCPTCGSPSQIREHQRIGHKQLSRPYYFSRWFFCVAVDCHTRVFYAPNDEFTVFNKTQTDKERERVEREHIQHDAQRRRRERLIGNAPRPVEVR